MSFLLKKNLLSIKSQEKIKALIYFNPENIDSLLFDDSPKNLLLKGYVKTPILNKKINFNYDYVLI